MPLHAATIFVSAFLLFLVQPLVALAPGGALVFQATNRFVDLLPLIRRLADEFHMQTAWIKVRPEDPTRYACHTDQVIVTKNAAWLHSPAIEPAAKPAPARNDLAIFTDNFHNLLRILKH
jgi:hypothetical protein